MSKHTPGPWKASDKPYMGGMDIDGPNGEEIGWVNASDGMDEPTMYPVEANARLIAAAPDLLNALNICLGWLTGGLEGDWADCDPKEVARAAIAKAEGR